MNYSQMQSISIALWILMIAFLIMALIQFFTLKIHQAWKIVTGTDFSIRGKKTGTDKTGSTYLSSQRLGVKAEISSNRLGVSGDTYSQSNRTYKQEESSEQNDETVALEEVLAKGCGEPESTDEATMVLSQENKILNSVDEDRTTVLIRGRLEFVVDLMFIHTEEKI